jgi:hypothetical protein
MINRYEMKDKEIIKEFKNWAKIGNSIYISSNGVS